MLTLIDGDGSSEIPGLHLILLFTVTSGNLALLTLLEPRFISAAFDTVYHAALLHLLDMSYGICVTEPTGLHQIILAVAAWQRSSNIWTPTTPRTTASVVRTFLHSNEVACLAFVGGVESWMLSNQHQLHPAKLGSVVCVSSSAAQESRRHNDGGYGYRSACLSVVSAFNSI